MEREQESMASSAALKAAKKELRGFMKHKLSSVSNDSINAQSAAVSRSVIGFRSYQAANRIGIYLSMPTGELQTDAIVRHALSSGKQVFVPYLFKPANPLPGTPKSVMDMVDLRSLSDYEALKRDSWGIPTIGADTVEEREHVLSEGSLALDMILMPGVAFDVDENNTHIRRLGHGKGFYDYFLHRYNQAKGSREKTPSKGSETEALLYGLALDEQFLKSSAGVSVPVGEHDKPLHGLFLGDGKIVEYPVAKE